MSANDSASSMAKGSPVVMRHSLLDSMQSDLESLIQRLLEHAD